MKVLAYLLSLLFCTTSLAQNSTLTSPAVASKPAVRKTLIVETLHPFIIHEYSSSIDMNKKMQLDQSSPEAIFVNYHQGLMSTSYEDSLKFWDEESQKMMLKFNKEKGFTPEKWKTLWNNSYTGKKVLLTHFVNYGKYVLLRQVILDSENKLQSENTMALKKVEDKWKLTQDLRADQIMNTWNGSQLRIQVPSSALLPESKLK